MSLLHKLDKKTRDRHFPESNGGKGGHSRTTTTTTRANFSKNHGEIDWSKPLGKSYIKSTN